MNPAYIIVIVVVILLILVIWVISTSNRLNRTMIKIEESLSGIDIALAKRYDVITKMIEVVKGYAKHEKETLFEVVKLRENMSLPEKETANNSMNENMKKINMIVENYPDLKASENFMELQKAIVDVEEHLQASRRCYNSNVSIYNQLIASYPTSIIAKKKAMTKKDFFQAKDEEKETVEADL